MHILCVLYKRMNYLLRKYKKEKKKPYPILTFQLRRLTLYFTIVQEAVVPASTKSGPNNRQNRVT